MDGCADSRGLTGIEGVYMDAALLERIVVDFRVFEVNTAELAEIIQMVAVANDISDE